ncbi:ATPase-like, ParA/MinD [Desulfonatronospira thiodismutans ASO3-1]|uniref:Iron-sulfur cluster carrier protein n=1 Tax=Desulfonatronospira thiodismutans ASO3-1 TaxID=555779 RepID=D6SUP9_9BACT|nr:MULTISPECIES: Mrp/NBP35 family ATP-binding protein [Desulfonatronospira]EFI33029.1 ATPase-like, ParA/MinD [Desulfonatronospira thiodismutans ASO3-1]RQD78262.1 MAG: ATP-binding protein [Desulfonatronospira sp. MSAO_Bac3]
MIQEGRQGCNPGEAGHSADSRQSRSQEELLSSVLSRIRYKIFIMSGKGGVGKSSVAVNLAAALAAEGNRTGLLDVDIHGPSVPRLLGITGLLEVGNQSLIEPKRYNERLSVMSMESLLKDPDQAILWKGPMKTSAIRQFISNVRWGDLDYLVVDSPPGTGDEPMTVLKTIPDALCIVVTTPQEVSLADVRKAVNFLQYAKANILGLVENMSGMVCPHCSKDIALFKAGGGRALATRYGIDFLGSIPLDPASIDAAEKGTPVVLSSKPSPAKDAHARLAAKVDKAAKDSLEAVSTSHKF